MVFYHTSLNTHILSHLHHLRQLSCLELLLLLLACGCYKMSFTCQTSIVNNSLLKNNWWHSDTDFCLHNKHTFEAKIWLRVQRIRRFIAWNLTFSLKIHRPKSMTKLTNLFGETHCVFTGGWRALHWWCGEVGWPWDFWTVMWLENLDRCWPINLDFSGGNGVSNFTWKSVNPFQELVTHFLHLTDDGAIPRN